jgi:hypothetical protein
MKMNVSWTDWKHYRCRILGSHTGSYEEFYLMGFRQTECSARQLSDLLLGLFFDTEDGNMFRNVG